MLQIEKIMAADQAEEFAKYRPRDSYYYEGSGLGPEGLRDYRPHLVGDPQAIGIGEVSSEQSLDSGYVLRAAPGATFERPRSCKPGEIGWGIPWLVDWTPANTGQQIMLGDFRQMAEDRTTHEGTGAWYPHPEQQTPVGSEGYYKENIYSGRPDTNELLSSVAAGQRDLLEDVCPEPVDSRAPFRLFNVALHHDTTLATSGSCASGAAGVGRGGGGSRSHKISSSDEVEDCALTRCGCCVLGGRGKIVKKT